MSIAQVAYASGRKRQQHSLLMARSVVDIFAVSPPPSSTVVAIIPLICLYNTNPQPPHSRIARMFISEMADSPTPGRLRAEGRRNEEAAGQRPKTPGACTCCSGSIVLKLINRPTNRHHRTHEACHPYSMLLSRRAVGMGLGLGPPTLPFPRFALPSAHKQQRHSRWKTTVSEASGLRCPLHLCMLGYVVVWCGAATLRICRRNRCSQKLLYVYLHL